MQRRADVGSHAVRVAPRVADTGHHRTREPAVAASLGRDGGGQEGSGRLRPPAREARVGTGTATSSASLGALTHLLFGVPLLVGARVGSCADRDPGSRA